MLLDMRVPEDAFAKAYSRYTTASAAERSLRETIETLTALIPEDVAENANVDSIVTKANKQLSAQRAAGRTLLKFIPPTFRHSQEPSDLAIKVFDMPELLEHILSFLATDELWSAFSVNSTFQQTIEGSVKLMRKLGLLADHKAHFFAPVKRRSDLRYFGSFHFVDATDWVPRPIKNKTPESSIPITIECRPSYPVYAIGERRASSLVTQPPVRKLAVYTKCCTQSAYGSRSRPPTETLVSKDGITLGQIHDVVTRLQKEHKLCPDASAYQHDEEGFVETTVTFEGFLELDPKDPALTGWKKSLQDQDRLSQKDTARARRITRYIAAKQAGQLTVVLHSNASLADVSTARDRGHPIPTLAEYEASLKTQQT